LDDPAVGRLQTDTGQSVTGECTANIRKGKTIFYYELEVKVPWEGQLNGAEVIKGQLHLPYISEEHDDDKMEVQVTCDKSGAAADRLIEMMRVHGVPLVQKKVAAYLSELRQEFSVKQPSSQSPPPTHPTLPTPSQSTLPPPPPISSSTPPPPPVSSSAVTPPVPEKTEKAKSEKKPSESSYKTLNLKEEFTASVDSVYRMLTDPQMLNAITQGSAKFEPKEGTTFSLFGDNVAGENVQLVPPSKIVQKWRFNTWRAGHYSTVQIDLSEKKGKTILQLTQKEVPSDDFERTEDGWKRNIFGRGKMMFGFGPAQIY